MINSKKELKFYLKEDARRNRMNVSKIEYYIRLAYGSENARAYKYLKALRLVEYYTNCKDTLWSKFYAVLFMMRLKHLSLRYGISIPINTVGYGLRIHHTFGGIILNCKKMGNYCGVNSGVVIGNNKTSTDLPSIGHHVMINTGAKVFGDIIIGNDVIIGANAVVIHNVDTGSIVAGIPAKLIKIADFPNKANPCYE